jgi:hypothetical protein
MNAINEPEQDSAQLKNQESRAMTNEMNRTENTDNKVEISREALAHLGDGRIAYVKTIRSEDVPSLFPQAPEIAPGLKLFALHAADGTPIMLTDSREAAIANAWSQELETVSVH